MLNNTYLLLRESLLLLSPSPDLIFHSLTMYYTYLPIQPPPLVSD